MVGTPEDDVSAQYLLSIYWAFTTMTTGKYIYIYILLSLSLFLSVHLIYLHQSSSICLLSFRCYNSSIATAVWIAIVWACYCCDAFHIEVKSDLYICTFVVGFTGVVGYGDIVAGNNSERIVSITSMFLGGIVFAYFVGSMSR